MKHEDYSFGAWMKDRAKAKRKAEAQAAAKAKLAQKVDGELPWDIEAREQDKKFVEHMWKLYPRLFMQGNPRCR